MAETPQLPSRSVYCCPWQAGPGPWPAGPGPWQAGPGPWPAGPGPWQGVVALFHKGPMLVPGLNI